MHDIDDIRQLTYDVQGRYINWRRTRHGHAKDVVSNGTINREMGVLRAALNDAKRRGMIQDAPSIRGVASPPPRERFLTQPDFQRLLAACHTPHLRDFVLLAVHTMQRPGAILSLRTCQVDLGHGRIDFLPPGAVQSKKRRPVVPITATIRPILEQAVAMSESGHVIEYQGLPIKCIRNAFGKACRRAGLVGVSPVTLRHSGATLAAAAGVPMRQISGMLGHTTTKTTEAIYAKHHPDFLKDAANALDEIFAVPDGPESAGGVTRCAPGFSNWETVRGAKSLISLERVKGFEPSTSTLARQFKPRLCAASRRPTMLDTA